MASSSKESFSIEKLNSNNYVVWKLKIELILIKENLHSNITADPLDPITNDWTKMGNKARQ